MGRHLLQDTGDGVTALAGSGDRVGRTLWRYISTHGRDMLELPALDTGLYRACGESLSPSGSQIRSSGRSPTRALSSCPASPTDFGKTVEWDRRRR